MNYEKYNIIEVSDDFLTYLFMSTGPKGNILKIIQFETTDMRDVYNLSFGNLNKDGSIDDMTVNDNQDRDKILATIVSSVYQFTARFPDQMIIFTGSTPGRTRLYRMAICLHLEELSADFQLFGILYQKNRLIQVPFEKNENYFSFFIRRK